MRKTEGMSEYQAVSSPRLRSGCVVRILGSNHTYKLKTLSRINENVLSLIMNNIDHHTKKSSTNDTKAVSEFTVLIKQYFTLLL